MTASVTDVVIVACAVVASVALSVFSVRWALRNISRDISTWEKRADADFEEWVQRQSEKQEKRADAGGRGS